MFVNELDGIWYFLRRGAGIILVICVMQSGAFAEDEVAPENWEKNKLNGDAAAVAAGKAHWKNIGCYACHGRKAEGGVGPSLSDDIWIYKPTDKMVYNAFGHGSTINDI